MIVVVVIDGIWLVDDSSNRDTVPVNVMDKSR